MEAAHIFGGYMYTLATVCLELNIECVGLAVKSIKKFMTGTGNATKDQMIAAARSQGFDPKTDDEADAIAILLLGVSSTIDFQNCHIKKPLKTIAKGCLRVLPSSDNERLPSPRDFASVRNFSEVDQLDAGPIL